MKNIKLRNFEVEGIVNTLEKRDSLLYTNDPEKKLPVSVLWIMDENMDRLREIVSRIQKKREEIQSEYADDDHSFNETQEDGSIIRKVKNEYVKEFMGKMNELMSIENEINIKPIMISFLENRSLVPSDYRSIRFMLDKEKTEEDQKDETENQ